MQYQNKNENESIKQNSLHNPFEKERLLRQYQGIFKDNIQEFAEMIPKANRKVRNMSK